MGCVSAGDERGAVPLKAINALVAVAFVVLCAVLVFRYLSDPGGKSASGPASQSAQQSRGPSGTLQLMFYSSSAKKKWVDEMVKAFNDSGQRVGDREIVVKTYHVNSGDSLDDLKEGKITLPLVYFVSELEKGEGERLAELFKSQKAKDRDYEDLVRRVRTHGAIERVRSEASEYVERAGEALGLLPDSPGRRSLMELGTYILTRRR